MAIDRGPGSPFLGYSVGDIRPFRISGDLVRGVGVGVVSSWNALELVDRLRVLKLGVEGDEGILRGVGLSIALAVDCEQQTQIAKLVYHLLLN
jgi:hypothetical protein